MPEKSLPTLPDSSRGPAPFLYFLPSEIAVIAALATTLSTEPQKPSVRVRSTQGGPIGSVGGGVVDRQRPSLPVVAQPTTRAGARLPLVTTSVYGPAATVTCAETSAPVVAPALAPCTVATTEGSKYVVP